MNKNLTFAHLKHRPQVLVFAVILIIVLIITVLNILGDNNNYKSDNKSSCWLAGNSCDVVLADGKLTVVMDRLPTIEEQIPLTITLPDNTELSSAVIEGVNMYMGKVPVPLRQGDNGDYQGWFMLGACTEPTMQWRMSLTIKNRPEPVWIFFTTQM